MPENLTAVSMRFIGLLTHEQKQAGYFVSQDEDFVHVYHRANGIPRCISIFLYETATIKGVREAAESDMNTGVKK